jgi:hypothetical protein
MIENADLWLKSGSMLCCIPHNQSLQYGGDADILGTFRDANMLKNSKRNGKGQNHMFHAVN